MQISDGSGSELLTKIVRDDQDVIHNNPFVGPQSTMQKEMPKIYAQMIQRVVRDAEVMDALLRPVEGAIQSSPQP